MQGQSHLNRWIDVQKHALAYKKVKVTGPDYSKSKLAALKYFEGFGYIMLFREISFEDEVSIFEGLVVTVGS